MTTEEAGKAIVVPTIECTAAEWIDHGPTWVRKGSVFRVRVTDWEPTQSWEGLWSGDACFASRLLATIVDVASQSFQSQEELAVWLSNALINWASDRAIEESHVEEPTG